MANDAAKPAAKVEKKKDEEVVSMTDGRLVTFAGKRLMQKESLIDDTGSIKIRIDFRNGATRLITLPESLIKKFAAHGAEQKYGDETAGIMTDGGTIDDMVLAVDELDEHVQKGEWSTRAEGSGLAGTSVLVKALVEHSGKPVETIKAYLKGKTQKEKVALRNNPKVKVIVDRIEAEKLAKSEKVDTGAMLAELEAA